MAHLSKRILIALLVMALSGVAEALNPYSTKELDSLEKEFMELINQSSQIVRIPMANQYVNHLAHALTQNTSGKTPFIFIVKSDEINAFAGPGGNIGLNTQLILTSESESELAAVLAHEIAHVRLNHLYRLILHEKQMKIPMLAAFLASAALSLVNPTLASGAMMASMSGFAQDKINFTRSNEKEADRIGINMLTRAGFNPYGMVNFFKKMQQSMRYYYTEHIPAILRTHPLDDDRIAEALNRIDPKYKHAAPPQADYYLFRELIRNEAQYHNQSLLEYYAKECFKHAPDYACEYGKALAYIHNHQLNPANVILQRLIHHDQSRLYYHLALAQVDSLNKHHDAALTRVQQLYRDYPDNYALLIAYSNSLLEARQPEQAIALLIKGFRIYKRDLPLCETLAQAYSENRQARYAYFTQAQCELIQGHPREAVRQLKVARTMSLKDTYLLARIDALTDEIRFQLAK